MTPQEELEKLSAEARERRQRAATAERRAESHVQGRQDLEDKKKQLKKKIRQLEEDNRALEEDNRALEEDNRALEEKAKQLEEQVKALEARLAGVTLHKDKLIGMIFKTNNKKEPENG